MHETKHTFVGGSHLLLFLIPTALAIAALLWLTFATRAHNFGRDLSQESRRAEFVGANPLPSAPLRITIQRNGSTDGVLIDKAEDGNRLWLHYKNTNQYRASDICFDWMLQSPDGTIIKNGTVWAGKNSDSMSSLLHGESSEISISVETDKRAASISVRPYWSLK